MRNGLRGALHSLDFLRRRREDHADADVDAHERLDLSVEFLVAYLAARLSTVTFVQVGAFDGVTDDVVGRFARRFGWRGVVVEPQPEAFAKLREVYHGHPQIQLVNAAVGETDGSTLLHRIRPDALEGLPVWAEQTATLDAATLARHVWAIPDLEDRVEARPVASVTPETLIERYDLRRADLVAIDAEGADGRILRGFDRAGLRPLALTYEHGHLPPDEQRQCLRLLVDRGYRVGVLRFETLALRSMKS